MKLKLFSAATIAILFAFSCKKDGNNPLHNDGQVAIGSYLSITETINQNVDFADPASTAAIKVKSVGAPIDKIEMYVVEGASLDASTWKFLKSVPYTGEGTELSASNAEMVAALGVDLQPGFQYTIYDRVFTTDGRTFDLVNAGPNVESPDFSSAFEWTANAVAPFTGNMAGDYTVVRDDWQDYSVGDVIFGAVEDGPGANQISLHVYPNPAIGTEHNPIIIDIDPATGVATVPYVEYGDYLKGFGDPTPYQCDGGGYVFSATGTVDVTFTMYYGGSPFSNPYRLVIKKK